MAHGWDTAAIEACNDIDYLYDRVCLLGIEFERGTATEQEWIDAALGFLHGVEEAVVEHGDTALGDTPAWAAFLATEWVSREYLDIADVWGTVSELVHATCGVQNISPAALRLIVSHMIRAGQEGIRCSESRPATRIVAWYRHEIDFLSRTADFCADLYDVVENVKNGVMMLNPVIEDAPASALPPVPAAAPAMPRPHDAAAIRLKALLDAVEETRPTSDDRIRAFAAVFEAFIETQHLFPRDVSFSRLLTIALEKLIIEAEHYTYRFENLAGVRSIDELTTSLMLALFGLTPRPFRRRMLSRTRQLHALRAGQGPQADGDPDYRTQAGEFYDELIAFREHTLVTDACTYEDPETMMQILGINDLFTIDEPGNFIELRSGRIRRREPTVIARPGATDDVTGYHGLAHTETHETNDVVVIVDDRPQTPPGNPPPFFGGGRPELAEGCEYVNYREDPDCAHEFMFPEPDTSDDGDEYDDCFDSEGEWDRAEFERRRDLIDGGWVPIEAEIEEQRRHEFALSLRDH